MIKYWQSMQDYKHFLTECKVHFDSSERNRLHTELWKPWQKLQLFDTNKASMVPEYYSTAFGDEFDKIGECATRGKDRKTYYVPADMTYLE